MATTIMSAPAATPTRLHRFTVDEYERMATSDALDDPKRVELINGYMVDKMPKSAGHSFSTKKTITSLEVRLIPGWTWRSEQPIRIPDYDEPEPDISVVQGSDEDYEHRHPGPGEVGMAVEVSLSTLDHDRYEKGPAYARGRIPIYWIVNLVDRQIEVYSQPGPDGYQFRDVYVVGQAVPVVIGGVEAEPIDVRSILPSEPERTDGVRVD